MKEKIITFGEIMLRLSPENSERFTQCHSFEAVYGGGEANTAVSLSNFGVDAAYVTKLPKSVRVQSMHCASTVWTSVRLYAAATRLVFIFWKRRPASDHQTLFIIEAVQRLHWQKKVILTGMPFLQMQHGSIFQESHRQSAIHWLRSA